MQLNILSVDDETLFRKGSVMLLKSFSVTGEVYEASNGLEALKMIGTLQIDLVLLDLDMPVMDGTEAAKKILSKYPEVKVIILSQQDDLSLISKMIEIGVHSYLLKSAEPSEVKQAIDAVIANDFYYNQIVSKALRSKVKIEKAKAERDLTKREVEILELICEELSVKEIGDRLFVSEQTIQTHRKNMMRKLDIHSAVGLVKYAINQQIISL